MKRYLVFAWGRYEARGGWWDFVGAFASFEEANSQVAAHEKKDEWTHIVDLARLEMVHEASWAPDWPHDDGL